jgi:hypothetical protein
MAMCHSRPGVDLEQVQLLCCHIEYMIEYLAAYMLSGRRVQSMGGQAIRVFYGPAIPAAIGCLWYRVMDMYPIPDRRPVKGFRVAGGFSLAPADSTPT